MTIKVTGIDSGSELAEKFDMLDLYGNGEITGLSATEVWACMALFLDQDQGTFTVEFE